MYRTVQGSLLLYGFGDGPETITFWSICKDNKGLLELTLSGNGKGRSTHQGFGDPLHMILFLREVDKSILSDKKRTAYVNFLQLWFKYGMGVKSKMNLGHYKTFVLLSTFVIWLKVICPEVELSHCCFVGYSNLLFTCRLAHYFINFQNNFRGFKLPINVSPILIDSIISGIQDETWTYSYKNISIFWWHTCS